MNIPKPIHKFLLGEGFRQAGSRYYCKFFPDKPAAWYVSVEDIRSWEETSVLQIQLQLCFSNHRLINSRETLWPDGLLRPQGWWDKYFDDRFDEALAVLRTHLRKWMAVIANPEVMIAQIDFEMALRSEPPPEFAYLAKKGRAECIADYNEKIHYLLLAERYADAEDILLNNVMQKGTTSLVSLAEQITGLSRNALTGPGAMLYVAG